MINHKTVEQLRAEGVLVQAELERVDRGARVMCKLDNYRKKRIERAPPDMGTAFAQATQDGVDVSKLGGEVRSDLCGALAARYTNVVGPTVIKSWGKFREQLAHVDMARSHEMR